ncbi:MAG: hypothetical protein HC906_15600 [Bacteroidales bacterium]|nr:hypothetical protein [Bacteroidales bacterium]
MRTIGYILLIIGAVGSIGFGIQALNKSEGFSLFGLDIGVSTANWTPLIISAVILLIGIILLASLRRSGTRI